MLQYVKDRFYAFKKILAFTKNSAIKNFIYFFILMIVLTLLSNIAAGLTIAQVRGITPMTSYIYNRVEASGKVQADQQFYLELPIGLKIDKIAVSNGQSVKNGDLLLQVNLPFLKKEIEMRKVDMSRKKIDMQLSIYEEEDNTAFSFQNAQEAFQNATADYEYIIESTNRAVDIAKADLLSASRDYRIARKEYFQMDSDNEDGTVTAVKNYEKAYKEYEKARDTFFTIDFNYKKALANQESEDLITKLEDEYEIEKAGFAKVTEAYNRACRTFDSALALSESVDDPAGFEELKTAKKAQVEQQRNMDNVMSESKRQLELSERSVQSCRSQLDNLEQVKEVAAKKIGMTQSLNKLIVQQFVLSNENDEKTLIRLEQIEKTDGMIYAERDGRVLNIEITDNVVSNAKTLAFTSMESGYSFAFSVSSEDSVTLDSGKLGKLKLGDKTLDATIMSVAPTPNENGNIEIVAKISSADLSGVYHSCEGDINIEKSKNKYDLCLPISAVKHDQTGDFVYSLEERQNILGIETILVKNSVEIFEMDDEMVAVNGALDQKSNILLSSNKIVGEGDRVRLIT